MRLISGVRVVLGRAEAVGQYRETDRLAATLAFHWAGGADPGTPIGRLVETGAVSDATVDALYRELVALEQGSARNGGGGWTDEAVVRALLDYAAVHRPRGPVPGWAALRDERIAARVFG